MGKTNTKHQPRRAIEKICLMGNLVFGILSCAWVWFSVGEVCKPSEERKRYELLICFGSKQFYQKSKNQMKHKTMWALHTLIWHLKWIQQLITWTSVSLQTGHMGWHQSCWKSWGMGPTFRFDGCAWAKSRVNQSANKK